MLIIGCDFHTRYQQIAMAEDSTGELLTEWSAPESAGEIMGNSHIVSQFL